MQREHYIGLLFGLSLIMTGMFYRERPEHFDYVKEAREAGILLASPQSR